MYVGNRLLKDTQWSCRRYGYPLFAT